MKNFLLLISLCFFSVITNATTYYISTTGSDANPGTISAPFKTWERISAPRYSNLLAPGDIVYIRGGTYASPHSSDGVSEAVYWSGINGNSSNYITIQNYPGETVILDCSNMPNANSSYPTKWMIYMANCSYVKVKGLHIQNLRQILDGSGVSRGFGLTSSNFITLEQIEVDHCGGNGFDCDNSNDITYLNCDSHHNADALTDAGADAFDNADGFNRASNSSTRITYTGCRAWLNSDDGWDFINSPGTATFNSCWGYKNGYYQATSGGPITLAGNGEGFKLGFDPSGNQTITRWLNNCLAFDNGDAGFNNNGDPQTRYQLYNCTAFRNGAVGFEFGYGSGEVNTFKNNISYNNVGSAIRYYGANTNNTNNTWNGSVTLNNADFQSLDTTGVSGARQSDGSLPNLNFLRLAASSDLINKGVIVGLPYVGALPDMGAFEFGVSAPVPVTLVDFYASEKSGKTLLQWATVTEVNSSYFEVQRSNNGLNYESIGTVNATGNSSTRIDYQLMDYYPLLGVNYYRLRIVDKDGQFEYSKIVSINFRNNANTGSFEIKSAVINNKTLKINVSSSKPQSAVLGLYDAAGRAIFVSDITLQKGVNNINKIITPSSAVYYLILKTSDKSVTLPLFSEQ